MIYITSICKILGTGLFFIWNNTKFVLSLLINNLFATHYWYNFVNISSACLCAISELLLLVIIAVSSAYYLTALCPVDLYKWFIHSKKNNGPNTEPCGTPHDTVRKSEFTPFMTVYWRLLVEYDLKKSLTTHEYRNIAIYAIKFHDLLYRTPSWSLWIYLLHSFFHQVGFWYGLWFQLMPAQWNITYGTRIDNNIISYSALKMKPTFYKVSFQIFYQNGIED